MKVLIIDNTLDQESWGARELRRFVTRATDRTAFVRRGPNADLPRSLRGIDRIIISGSRSSCLEKSEWVNELDGLLREAISVGKPTLGVCYGHQALNRAVGGVERLRKAPVGEFGWTEIEVLERAPLFQGLPDRFWSFSSHYEEVCDLPKGMRLLARSADCGVQACRYEDLPIYGIQFHAERNLEEAKRSIANWRKDDRKNIIRHPDRSEKFYDPKVGDTIFANFLKEDLA
jgi:GMP synthase (glutamine-hydrolysing)